MKKINDKQLAYSYKKAAQETKKLQTTFVLTILLFVAVMCTIGIFTDPVFATTGVKLLGGSTIASMMLIGNVSDLSDKYTTGNNIARELYIIDILEQVDTSTAFPQPNASREVGTVPLKSGQKMIKFQTHSNPKLNSTGESSDNAASGTNTLEIALAGNTDQLKNYAEQHLGSLNCLIFRNVDSTGLRILGSYDNPVKLKSFEIKDDAEGRYVIFKFERSSILQDYKYTGSIIAQDPATHTAGSATLAITSGQDVYQTPNGSSATYAINAVSGLTASDKGRVITLLGTGTTYPPTLADSATFILEDGSTWTGKAGSKLVLKVLDASTLVEVQGSRIQTS